ncbi:MAG TPA: serine/threonine-protein kinase [Ktedonobacterales bacterium]|nr:serine/threonine-protein kinase [Ktedonobacterales bacterium]
MLPSGDQGSLVGSMLGGYRLTALLGAGGMAEVYQGRDPGSGRDVAVKVLPRALAQDPGYVNRFRDEARRVAALKHPNVVPLLRYGEEGGLLYIVMPVLTESLRDRMERDRVIPPTEAAKLTVQVAAALDAAHKQGLVHRDVKPENVLISSQGRALLTDFGISREVDVLSKASAQRTLAATGLPVGTPEYMAPEQLRGGAFDQRVDIYALGAVLYEMLTGHVPHDANTPYEVAALVLTKPIRPPSQYNPAIWPALEKVVMRALAPEAGDRYPNMLTFATDLRHAVVGEGSRLARGRRDRAMFSGNLRLPASWRVGSGVAAGAAAAAFASIKAAFARGPRDGLATLTAGRNKVVVGALAALVLLGVLGGGTAAGLRLFGHQQTTLALVSNPKHTEAVVAPPTATATATATPVPPTATPVPVRAAIVLDTNAPQTQLSKQGGGCTGKVTMTNTTGGALLWLVKSPDDAWVLAVGSHPFNGDASGTIPAGQSVMLSITRFGSSCTNGNSQQFSVLVNGTAVASFSFKY